MSSGSPGCRWMDLLAAVPGGLEMRSVWRLRSRRGLPARGLRSRQHVRFRCAPDSRVPRSLNQALCGMNGQGPACAGIRPGASRAHLGRRASRPRPRGQERIWQGERALVCPSGGQAVAVGVWRQPAIRPCRTRAAILRDGSLRKTGRLLIDAVRPRCDARPMRSAPALRPRRDPGNQCSWGIGCWRRRGGARRARRIASSGDPALAPAKDEFRWGRRALMAAASPPGDASWHGCCCPVNGYVRPRIFGEQDLVRMGGPASAVAVSTQEIFFEDRR